MTWLSVLIATAVLVALIGLRRATEGRPGTGPHHATQRRSSDRIVGVRRVRL